MNRDTFTSQTCLHTITILQGMSTSGKSKQKKHIIIDTDVGSDDALCIAIALNLPDDVEVHAITTCFGNVPNEQVVINVATILKLFRHAHVPFYVGASAPLVSHDLPHRWLGHGLNGLGGSDFTEDIKRLYAETGNTDLPLPREEPAVRALLRMVEEKPDFYDILAIGPLTNLALAVKIDPKFAPRCKSLTWMGGSASGKGNATLAAEFNAHADADAAHAVFAAWPDKRLTMVPWELCHAGGITWPQYHAITSGTSFMARYLKKITVSYELLSCHTVQVTGHLNDSPLPKLTDVMSEEEALLLLRDKSSPAAAYMAKYHNYCPEATSLNSTTSTASAAAAAAEEAKVVATPAAKADTSGSTSSSHGDGHGGDVDTGDVDAAVNTSSQQRMLPRYCPADVYALFALLHPEAVTRQIEAYCAVETAGKFTRGYIAVDWYVNTMCDV